MSMEEVAWQESYILDLGFMDKPKLSIFSLPLP